MTLQALDAVMRRIEIIRQETGQALPEYSLILFFVAVVAIAALTFLGSDISSVLSRVGNAL